MARFLTVRKPTLQQLRHLEELLENAPSAWQRRHAEVLLLYAAGHEATSIAHALQAHPNTIYADLHAFEQHGLRSVQPGRRRGAVARITAEQRSEMLRLAETAPDRTRSALGPLVASADISQGGWKGPLFVA